MGFPPPRTTGGRRSGLAGSQEVNMDGRTANRFRRRLLSDLGQRGLLLGKLKRSIAEQGEQASEGGGLFASHMAEAATAEAERDSVYILFDAEGRAVQEIEAALQRIEAGNFGVCELCNKPIDKPRLEAIPYARFCLRCQERSERLARN